MSDDIGSQDKTATASDTIESPKPEPKPEPGAEPRAEPAADELPASMEDFASRKVSIEIDERKLLWGIVGVLCLLVVIQGATLMGLRGRIRTLEGFYGGGAGNMNTGMGFTPDGSGMGMDSGFVGEQPVGWGDTAGGGLDPAAGTATGNQGVWGVPEPSQMPDGSGQLDPGGATTGQQQQPQAAGFGSAIQDETAVMQRLDGFVAKYSVDQETASQLRAQVSATITAVKDISAKAAAGELDASDRYRMEDDEKAKLQSEATRLLGPELSNLLLSDLFFPPTP